MNLHSSFCFTSILFLAALCSCQPVPWGSSSEENIDEGMLTDSEKGSIEAAVDGARAISQVVIVILPIVEVERLLGVQGPAMRCPAIGNVLIEGAEIDLALEYGQSCEPPLYPGVMVGGSAAGSLFPSLSAFDLALPNIVSDGRSLIGTAAGGFTDSDGSAIFAFNLAVTVDNLLAIRGSYTVSVDLDHGNIVVDSGTMQIESPLEPLIDVSLRGVRLEPGAEGLMPSAGVAEIRNVHTPEAAVWTSLDVAFDSHTANEGLVEVQVGGGAIVNYRLTGQVR